MVTNVINEDLRSRKTKKALYDAMVVLLNNSTFKKITIKEICEEAYISRAAFYAHFIDKYDLLQNWLKELISPRINHSIYEQFEIILNNQSKENKVVITNLVYEADNETFLILFNFLLEILELDISENTDEATYTKQVVLANFYAGGVISYLLWQVENNFPKNVPLMNEELYKFLREIKELKKQVGGNLQ